MRHLATRVVAGAAIAEATLWTGLFDRAHLLPPWTRRKRREIEHDHDVAGLLDLPVPFALNVPATPLYAAPGPRSEWLAFQVGLVASTRRRYDLAATTAAWRGLADDAEAPRLSISQRAALDGLLAGVAPPLTGHDHARHADDAACVRALALATLLPDDGALLCAVRDDATITNAEDGVWCAEAVAVALTATARGDTPERAVAAAAAHLPPRSWSAERLHRALRIGAETTSSVELALRLDHDVANAAYSYGDAAPDVVAIALTIFRTCHPRVDAALLAALAVPRHAAAVAPLVGAICAAGGALPFPLGRTRELIPSFLGVSLPRLRGVHPLDVLDTTTHDEGA